MSKETKAAGLEPEFLFSATNQPVLNYRVYNFKTKEKIFYSVLAFVVGAAVAYLFYGGIGKDAYGQPTVVTYICNAVFMIGLGVLAVKIFLPIRKKQILDKRFRTLHRQFVDLLDSLSASLTSGHNVPNAFLIAKTDISVQHAEDSYIMNEIKQIVDGMANNVPIEQLLKDFGQRSGLKDIYDFGQVFEISYRKGGNIKDIIRSTHEILSTKSQLELEIQTKITSNKNEQNIMMIMPVVIVGMIKMMGGDFAENFTTPSGILFTTIGVGLFILSYFIGKSVMKIDV